MKSRVVYGQTTRYFVGDTEVSEEQYHVLVPSKLKEMLASQSPPHGVSNYTYTQGMWEQPHLTPREVKRYQRYAKKNRVNTSGKVYLRGLARFPGDPQAWVDGRDDIKRICEQRGMGTEGLAGGDVKAPELDKEPEIVDLADDIVDAQVQKMILEKPSLKKKDKRELKEAVKDKHTPPWKKRK